MKRVVILSLLLGVLSISAHPIFAQEQSTQQPTAEEAEKEKVEREKNAYRMLDQVIDEAQSLRLPENRVRVQISSADLLWKNNQGRARSLFSMAADGVAELGRPTTQPTTSRVGPNGVPLGGPNRGGGTNRNFQLRQELVLAAARHDAALAYQLLAATKPPAQVTTTTTATDQRNQRPQPNVEDNLEQTLLGRIAALDPKLAAQNAEVMLDKGQFPRTLTEVINHLHKQDSEAAAKLADKIVKRIQATNLLTNNEAANLAQAMLAPGPRQPVSSTATTQATPAEAQTATRPGRGPVLDQAAYVDLLSSVVDAALKAAAPQTQTAQRGQNNTPRRVPGGPGQQQSTPPAPPSELQMEQANARRLIAGLQQTLPMLDQYLPSKAPLVRQKLTDIGISNNVAVNMTQNSLQGGAATSDTLMQMAANLPPQLQPRIYQQAAYRALDEGNPDRARQIANDHLQATAKDTVMQRIEFREMAKKTESTRIDEIRQTLSRLPSDNERLTVLLQLAKDIEKSNPKLMNQLLDDARQMTNRRASNYEHFDQQLRVAHAFATLDPARSFEVLDPGISQLNELLQAAAVLSGFEINLFREGEMTIQGGGGLTSTVNRYGQELALLARTDFERSETLAGRFQFPEPRIMARLSIVQGLLGASPATTQPTFTFARPAGPNVTIRQD
jgi:hypothetical protein